MDQEARFVDTLPGNALTKVLKRDPRNQLKEEDSNVIARQEQSI